MREVSITIKICFISQVATLISVCSTMVVVIRFVTTAVEERSNVPVVLDISWLTIERLVLVRSIGFVWTRDG